MSLHGKFRFLLAVFGISVVANVLVSVWCIHIYMAEATNRFEELFVQTRDTEVASRLLDSLTTELQNRAARDEIADDLRYRHLYEKIGLAIDRLPVAGSEAANLQEYRARLPDLCEAYISLLSEGKGKNAHHLLVTTILDETIVPMRRELARFARETDTALTQTTAEVDTKQTSVTAILGVNAAVAFLLVAVGVHLVRNWVLKPVDALKTAAEVHSRGDLQYRVPESSADELGTLARAVNRSAASLIEIQERLVRQERMAAIGEIAATVAHNIRNPLASVRAAAQTSLRELPEECENRQRLQEVIDTVDSLTRWLRELLMVSRPIEVSPRRTDVANFVQRVVDVISPGARRREIAIEYQVAQGLVANVDAPRAEQALLAIVENAVDASPPKHAVMIEGLAAKDDSAWVELIVRDCGGGIDPGVFERLGTPYVSTKPGGTGVGTHLARRITEAHGGNLLFKSNPGEGTMVTMRFPAVC